MRKGWDALKASTRERYEKNGISRSDYDGGASLKKARGHEKTPEHPNQYNPKDFPDYNRERKKLEKELAERKKDLWGENPRYNPKNAEKYIRERPPPLRLMRWAIEASEEELLDALREDPETFAFLGYH